MKPAIFAVIASAIGALISTAIMMGAAELVVWVTTIDYRTVIGMFIFFELTAVIHGFVTKDEV